jgi:hypothetical protein
MWTIYRGTADHPSGYALRGFTILPMQPEPVADRLAQYVPTLEAARALLPPGVVLLGRSPSDEPGIVETWV